MDFSYKKIWIITFPVMISLLMQNLIGMTDTAFLGRVGEVELGASALAGIYYMVIYMIGFGFSIGAEILMARRNGEGDKLAVGRIFYHGVIVAVFLSVALYLISYYLSPAILSRSISSDAIYDATMKYTKWRIFGFFFSFIAIMFRAFYMAITKTKILTINSIVMVGSNVVLNYILIFGKFGVPALGIEGAAIGSTLSELISLLFFFFYTRQKREIKEFRLFKVSKYSVRIQNQIFNVSIWTMIQYFVSCGTWLFFFMAIEHLGERSLAVSNLVRNISMLLYLFVSAFATTGSAMVSNLMGAGEAGKVMGLCGKIIKMCSVCTLPLIVFTILFPQAMLGLFTDNADLIASSLPSLRVMLVSYMFSVPAYVYFLAISGTGNTKATFWIELSVLSIYCYFTYLFAVHLESDVAVCWTVETIYGSMLLAICLLYFKFSNWRNKKI